MTVPALLLIVAYLLGAIPFGYLLVKWKTGSDVRASGSGNIGATNVLRTTGRAAGVATPAARPVVRSTLVAPILPLPEARTSTPVFHFTSR